MPIWIYIKKIPPFCGRKSLYFGDDWRGVLLHHRLYGVFHYKAAAHAAIFSEWLSYLCFARLSQLICYFDNRLTGILGSVSVLCCWQLTAMSGLMYQETGIAFSLGDGLFFLSAVLWGTFTVLLSNGNCRHGTHGRCCGFGLVIILCRFMFYFT